MRRVLPALGLLALMLGPAPAAAQRSLVIQSFHAAIDVLPDGTVVVEETIVPRFQGSWNGIFRTIPVEYRTPQGLNYTLRLDIEAVTDEQGRELRHESSRERHYRKLKIWIPGAVNAARTVRLRYRVANALRFFDEHDELYWNVTGDEWEVPILSASAQVSLPEGVSGVRATAFRGAYGSTQRANATIVPGGVRVEATGGLAYREGLTAVIGWNPGVVHRPTALEKTGGVVWSNLPLAVPPLVFLGMLWLWRTRGRDPDVAPIVTRYEPPDQLSPAEIGTMVDGRPDMRDITATIVDLAVRGYLRIEEIQHDVLLSIFKTTDYRFTLAKPREEWLSLRAHERVLLNAMFGDSLDSVTLSDLKNKFYKHLSRLRDILYRGLTDRGLYTGRPDRVRVFYIVGGAVAGAVLAVLGVTVMAMMGMQPLAGIVAGVLSGLIVALFGWFMPMRTVLGTRQLERVLGFQEFLSRVEADRLDRMVRTPEMFEKFLPYAMALGVAENWAKAFEDVARQPPGWYTGPRGVGSFQPTAFTSSMGRMSAQAATVMASAPRSSGGSGFGGGGSSGGGFGGGGGGGF